MASQLGLGEFTTQILEPLLVVGLNRMFTGGYPIWVLPHGRICSDRQVRAWKLLELDTALVAQQVASGCSSEVALLTAAHARTVEVSFSR